MPRGNQTYRSARRIESPVYPIERSLEQLPEREGLPIGWKTNLNAAEGCTSHQSFDISGFLLRASWQNSSKYSQHPPKCRSWHAHAHAHAHVSPQPRTRPQSSPANCVASGHTAWGQSVKYYWRCRCVSQRLHDDAWLAPPFQGKVGGDATVRNYVSQTTADAYTYYYASWCLYATTLPHTVYSSTRYFYTPAFRRRGGGPGHRYWASCGSCAGWTLPWASAGMASQSVHKQP